MIAPGFTQVADPVWGSAAIFAPPRASGDAGKVKTRVRQAGLTTKTLLPKGDNKVTEFLFVFSVSPSLHGSILKFGVNPVLLRLQMFPMMDIRVDLIPASRFCYVKASVCQVDQSVNLIRFYGKYRDSLADGGYG